VEDKESELNYQIESVSRPDVQSLDTAKRCQGLSEPIKESPMPGYGKLVLAIVITVIFWLYIRWIDRLPRPPAPNWEARIKRYCWTNLYLAAGAFGALMSNTEFSFADASLWASAVFLYVGGANPLLFALLAKARLGEELNDVERTEKAVNLTALFAVLLAVAWGCIGVSVYAQENKERTKASDELAAKIEHLEKVVREQEEAVSKLRDATAQETHDGLERNAKSDANIRRIDDVASAAGKDLVEVEDAIRKLRTGEAQDARVNDLLPKQEAMLSALNDQGKKLGEHEENLGRINKKLKLK
jgi:hypothetical protein